MAPILYYLILLPLSHLPFSWLYRLSDVMRLLLYYVVRYRRKVVRTNLINAFPDKSITEIRTIEWEFYRHLCDQVVEAIKMFSITEAQISKRFVGKHMDKMDRFLPNGTDVILTGGHLNSWEYLALYGNALTQFRMGGVYKSLSNTFFEKKMRKAREKFGVLLVPTQDAYAFFETKRNEQVAWIFATDQSPRNPERAYWTTFLNQETGVQRGAESMARKYGLPVVYGALIKEKRGHYSIEIESICDHPDEMPEPNSIIEKATRLLENRILQQPAYWLWSHKRWKHKKPPNAQHQSTAG